MQGHTLHTRLIALLCGAVLALATIAGTVMKLPAQDVHDPDVNYGYVYSGAKSSSTAFMKATLDDGYLLVFGSSELSTPASIIPQVPAAVFGGNDYGIQLAFVGEAYDQSLWHTIALGAYAQAGIVGTNGITGDKVVLIVGPGWFQDGGMDGSTFQTRFSYALYSGFCDNPSIPQETKDYVSKRLSSYSISSTTIDAATSSMPQDILNSLVFDATDDLRLRRDLIAVISSSTAIASTDKEDGETTGSTASASSTASDGSATSASFATSASSATSAGSEAQATAPDFDALRAQALSDAEAATTSNDWGVEDSFYTERIAPTLSTSQGIRAAETYTDTPEYDDLACFLDVCDANGIEPLVVISPVLGPYYDHIGIDAQTRETCYERIRQICESHGAAIADFSDKEYEKYFLFDIVHFGWTGWVDVEQAIYDFAAGDGVQTGDVD